MSVPIMGPLSVTPLYTAAGDLIVWWDGAEWQQLEVTAGTPPPTGGAGAVGGVGGGAEAGVGGGATAGVGGASAAALMQQISALEARLAALEGKV